MNIEGEQGAGVQLLLLFLVYIYILPGEPVQTIELSPIPCTQIVVQVEGEFGRNCLKPYFLGRMCFSSHTFPIRSVYSDRAASGCLTLISANSN